MEQRNHAGTRDRDPEFVSSYEIERQLEVAERRYELAVEARDAARAEWRELSVLRDAAPQDVMAAKARYDGVALRANRLRDLISTLEQKLDY